MSAAGTMSAVLPPQAPNIIDVDALEDDDVVFSGFTRTSLHSTSRRSLDEEGLVYMGFSSSNRPTSRRSHNTSSAQAGPSTSTRAEEVIVLDSDDEDGPSSSRASGSSTIVGVRSRLISPPPPPPLRGHTPAVPALPRHLASQASLPARRRPPGPQALPPIRPSDQPLPFEHRMASLPRLPPRTSGSPALAAAPRSHHQPAMGFGGALLALNRQNSIEEANRQQREETRNHFNLPSFTEIFRRISSYRGNSNAPEDTAGAGGLSRWQRFWPWLSEDVPRDRRNLSPFGDDDAWYNLPEVDLEFDRIKIPEKPKHYKPSYTHPDQPAPGFTFDFAPVDNTPVRASPPSEAGPSSAASSSSSVMAIETTLVCARCLDPLVLAAPEGAPEEERKKYRVWALRCGHMLDGKCIAGLIAPPPPVPVEPPVEEHTGKGKGKARAEPEVSSALLEQWQDTSDAAAAPSTTDRKGKRKAVEPLEPDEPPKRPALAESPPEDNSIRSRLRSRARPAADVTPPHANEGSSSASPPESPSRRRGGRRRGGAGTASSAKGKGKARARGPVKPVIEAEHEWRCPIVGCGRLHYSVLIEGEWRNDEGRGAIPLFV
ncbi:hypothetical protein L227DRAFT_548062 [Lentinus tigrinus ALCF2SS1-6]|uniref:Uncharacterized protein n=1 Tax=Lentinus tigrinus ALCF2SS1-6 TaxID=1328759 RepID=A0A5C2S854_9APHY|nr:hypothetical protein L227DRAFT_548062 [Lentinus tigrinus ALCF2SS1-6]